jgi:pyridoxal phosphate enzyme (YggS family)
MTMIADNLQRIHDRMAQACGKAGRPPDSVTLLAVSKTFGVDVIQQAHAAGQTAFGENYIQEAVEKITALKHVPLEWHCIGPVQSNKTRLVAEHFDWVHTIDRFKTAHRLSEQRPPHLAPLQVCIQVNMDGGPNKSGVAPSDALALARAVSELPRLCVRGIMCIPEPAPDFVAACAVFARARALFDQMNATGMGLDTLSMGMSDDLEAAITSGSTLVRVGSAIFGTRTKAPPEPRPQVKATSWASPGV